MPLYVLDNNTDSIYPVDGVGDTNPGRAGSAVFTDSDATLLIGTVVGLAWDGTNIFMSEGVNAANNRLFTVDIDNDSATLIGSFTLNGNTPPGVVHGMTWDGTNLYGVMYSATEARLVTIDRQTAALTVVGDTANFGISELLPQSLAWDGTDLWLTGFSLAGLVRVNKTTGIGTRVGSATQYGVSESSMSGLTFDGTNLYGSGRSTDALYTIDRTMGVATQVGSETRFGQDIRNSHGLVSTDFPAGTPANNPPSWTTTQTDYMLPANVAVNTLVANLIATDADNDTLTYSLTGTDAALFSISATGVVTVASSLSNDTTYNVTAVVSDSALQDTLDLTITVAAPGEMPVTPSTTGELPQIEGLHEYRERFDIVRSSPFGVVRENVEMIRHRGPTTLFRPAEASGLQFALTIFDFTPVYPIPDLRSNDWIVAHNPAGWSAAPSPSDTTIFVVQGPVEVGDTKRQVIVTKTN